MPTEAIPQAPAPDTSRGPRSLPLQQKVLLGTLLCVIIICGLLSVGVLHTFSRSFVRLENQAVEESVERVRRAIQLDLSHLERSARDYADWTESYNFVENPSEAYLATNLSDTVLANLKVDEFLLFDKTGRLVAGRSNRELVLRDSPLEADLTGRFAAILARAGKQPEAAGRGLMRTPMGIGLFACLPIRQDAGRGGVAGFLIQTRLLGEEAMDELRSITNLQLELQAGSGAGRSEGDPLAAKDGEWLRFLHFLEDPDGRPLGSILITMERQIMRHGNDATRILITGILVISVIAGGSILWLIRNLVTNRMERLHQDVRRIGAAPNLNARVKVDGTDEIGNLAEEINRMLTALEQSEAKQRLAKNESEHLQSQLQQAQKMEAIGAMAGGLAHDFNNMLNSILGSADLLQFELPPEHPGQEHVKRIEKAGISAAAIVRQLLAVSRRQSLKVEVIHLGNIVRDSMDLLRASLPKSISIDFVSETQTDNILADASQLHQVLINLATNAAHAMAGKDKASLSIRLSTAAIPDRHYPETTKLLPGNYVRLSVRDTGCGISPENQARIFEPFFTTKPNGSGTGLGLAVVHAIVSKHNGSIGLTSRAGEGSCFTLHLPLSAEQPQSQALQESHAPKRPLSILIVDDDRLVLDALATGLRRMGQEVKSTGSCEEALRLLADCANAFDALVTDQLMPAMTGLELGMHARELRPELPMLLISGHAAIVDSHMVQDRGFARIMMKPMTAGQLLEAIREAVGLKV